FPSTRKGTAKVVPGVGVRINHLDYWCEAMRDSTVENTQVKVRYDPFDVSIGFAYIDRKWRKCDCPYTEFANCSERELQLLTEELRKRNKMSAGRTEREITKKQLEEETLDTERSKSPPQEELSEQPKKSNPYENLLVLKRIEL